MESKTNIAILHEELDWLEKVIQQVISSYLLQEGHEKDWHDIPLPDLSMENGTYASLINEWNLNNYERLAMALCLAPHLKPELLDIFFGKNGIYDRGFTEFGGVIDKNHSGFIPTGQTLVFLITATHKELRNEVHKIVSKENILIKEDVLQLAETEEFIPKLNGILSLHPNWFHYFITNEKISVAQSTSFPAQKITSPLNWEDVVLDTIVMEQVNEILTWLEHGETLLKEWGLSSKIKPGYRALFYGPPGTGKSLTATLLGKATNKEVYRIDLSMIVSKYIGETEKNLSKVFDIARDKEWILFFDEADALFGKRTAANSSNDRHANQQTAHLLQLIEDFPGVVILASNLRANMDEAFTRRFQAIIHFNMPSTDERYQLWQNAFSGICTLSEEIDLYQIAEDYELAGGAIINVLRYCALAAIGRNDSVVTKNELLKGIKREFSKENKTLILKK
ncbi:ATP-binding protein [Flavobacterium piscis]|uniref:AAA+ superfamily predicted ATPase n=1 Tax=Flavobacterium piscis TaxID=1114874 RepID=A0ABU1YA34_9FLAO|nr:ATP-binding protein [Flavobacterium piscis]MDR7211097.1 AAA+ superfamily predicted ATPase [Flavobacterium piscis]